MFKTVKNKKIFEVILDQIKDLMINKALVVGQKMPSEMELSETMGISRSSLREALRVLDVLGILEAKAGGGTVLKPAEPENLRDIMSLIALSRGIETIDLFEVRTVIETYCTRLAAMRRTDEDLADMKVHLIAMDTDNTESNSKSDLFFHRSIVEASKNKILVMLIELISGLLHEQIKTTRSRFVDSDTVLKKFQLQHWVIYKCIEDQTANEAEEAVLEHLNFAQAELGYPPRYAGRHSSGGEMHG